MSYIQIDDERLWDYRAILPLELTPDPKPIKSDSSYRPDI